MRVVFCGSGWFPIVDAIRARLPAGATIRTRDPARPLVEEVAEAQVILPSNARIDATAIAAAKGLVLIQQPAAGYEGIDLEAARARDIPVCNAAVANDQAVAEVALFLMLALVRRYPEARRSFERAEIGVPLGRELRGMTLGLVGHGRSARRLETVALALGMTVLAIDSTSTPAELDHLLASSDVISVHCPLTAATRGLIGERALSRVKRGAYLVNCARGAILDREAVETALDDGRLAGLGLDVFWNEPWDPADPLFARDDVVTLPHLGGSTIAAFDRIAEVVAANIAAVMAGTPLAHRIA